MVKTLVLNACKEIIRAASTFETEKNLSLLGYHGYVRVSNLGFTIGLVNPEGKDTDPYYTYGFGISPGEIFVLDKQGDVKLHYGECYAARWAFQKDADDLSDGRVTI